MIVLDTHTWVKWIINGNQDLSEKINKTTARHSRQVLEISEALADTSSKISKVYYIIKGMILIKSRR